MATESWPLKKQLIGSRVKEAICTGFLTNTNLGFDSSYAYKRPNGLGIIPYSHFLTLISHHDNDRVAWPVSYYSLRHIWYAHHSVDKQSILIHKQALCCSFHYWSSRQERTSLSRHPDLVFQEWQQPLPSSLLSLRSPCQPRIVEYRSGS